MRRIGMTILLVVATAAWGIAPAAAVSHPVLIIRPAIAVGFSYSCGLSAGGSVDCWGIDVSGELGNGSTSGSSAPVPVHGIGDVGLLGGVTAISTSGVLGDDVACALLTAGTVDCWGANVQGQLGQGATTGPDNCSTTTQPYPCSTTPVPVEGVSGVGVLSGVKAIATGGGNVCALVVGGTVDCWGNGSPVPVPVASLSGVTAISGGFNDNGMCALTGGTADCWGDIPGTTSSATPVQVVGVGGVGVLSHVTKITVGLTTACALLAPYGTVDCWGSDPGNDTTNSSTPVPVRGVGNVGVLKGVSTISTGGTDGGLACASFSAGGTVDCWGSDGNTHLGNNSTTSSLVPVRVHGLKNVGLLSHATIIAVGGLTVCGLLSTGTVDCWGSELGNDTGNRALVPVPVHGVNNHGLLVL